MCGLAGVQARGSCSNLAIGIWWCHPGSYGRSLDLKLGCQVGELRSKSPPPDTLLRSKMSPCKGDNLLRRGSLSFEVKCPGRTVCFEVKCPPRDTKEGYLTKLGRFRKVHAYIDLTWGTFAALYLVAIYDLEPEWVDNMRTSSHLFYICLTALWKKVSVDHATMTSKIHHNCSKKIK